MYFRANLCIFGQIKKNPRKTQGPFENRRKNPRPSEKTQEPKIASKNPRSWEKTQAVATLPMAAMAVALDRNLFFGILQLLYARLRLLIR